MRRRAIRLTFVAGVAALLSTLAACSDSTEPEPVRDLSRSSQHFEFRSNTASATEAEMDLGIELAEEHWVAIRDLVGAERVPSAKVTVVLDGEYRADRTGGYVDENGWVHISRYRVDLGGYFGVLAHEIAHALRYTYWHRFNVGSWDNFGYIEEGFAEFVAIQVDPDKPGFPFYGYPPDVITGARLARGEGIPQSVMRVRHDLNSPCQWQTYPLRASWFRYVDEAYGRGAVLAIAYAEVETTDAMIEALLGATLEQVDADWEAWQRARYEAFPNAEQTAAPYFEKFGGEEVCTEGVDW